MEEEDLAIAMVLYRPTEKVKALVLELAALFDNPLPNGVVIDSITFKPRALKIGGLYVKKVEREHSHSAILIHWEPYQGNSNLHDPFCSAFTLRHNSLKKLYREIDTAFRSMRN